MYWLDFYLLTTSKTKKDKKVTKSKENMNARDGRKVVDTNARIKTSNGQEKKNVDDVDNTQGSLG